MAISFINGSSNAATGTSVTVSSEPTNAAEDDLLIAFVGFYNSTADGTITDPTDWTELDQLQETTGNDGTWYLGYKVRGATSGQALTWTTDGTAGQGNSAHIICLRGVDTTTPFDVTYARGSHYTVAANAPNTAFQNITTSTDNAWIILAQLHLWVTGPTGDPTGYTGMYEDRISQTYDGFYSAYKQKTPAGSDTPGAPSHTDSIGTCDPYNFTLALRPASSSGPRNPMGHPLKGPFGGPIG